MYAILKKELNYYFSSVVGYVFLASFCLVGGWFFVTSNLLNLNSDIGLVFTNMSSAFLFIIPLLTMNITALESKYGTDKLLYTSPISPFKIVMGKFLAILALYSLALAATCVYPLLLSFYSAPDFGVFVGNIIGYFLLGIALISIGVFVSTLTTHQVASAILTFAVLLILYLLDWLSPAFAGSYSNFIIDFFAVSKRFHLFSEGYINIADVVYYLSFAVIFVFFSTVVVKKIRKPIVSAVAILLVIVTFFSTNLLMGYLCDNYISVIDLTDSKVTTLSAETKQVLDRLDERVNIYSFVPEYENDGILVTINELLKKYNQGSKYIDYQRIDAENNQEFVKKYIDLGSKISLYSVAFECNDKFKVVNVADAVSFDNDTGTLENMMAEQYFTSAIINVTSKETVKVAVVSGHGEYITSNTLSGIFGLNNYELGEINLTTDNFTDEKMVVITSPQVDYSTDEIEKIDKFLKSGGSAQIFIGPDNNNFENLYSYLLEWGIEFGDGYVLENKKGNYVQSKAYLLPVIKNTPFTGNFYESNFKILMPFTRTITVRETEGIIAQVLLETTDKAFVKKNITEKSTAIEDGDKVGKFVLGAYVTKDYGNSKSSVLVVGSTAFVDNEYVNKSTFVNSEFLLKIAAHLTNNKATVSISPKSIGNSLLNITAKDVIKLGVLTVILIPLLFIALGIVIWAKRRRM